MNTKKRVLRVVLAAVVLGLGVLIPQKIAATHAPAWIAAGWLLTAMVVLRIVLALRNAARQLRRHTRDGLSLASADALATASMPAWLRGFYAMEKRAYRYSWRALSGVPVAASGRFGVAGGVQGTRRTASLLLTVALCAAAIGYCLPRYLAPWWPLAVGYAALAGVALYALVWIVGERRSLREGGHAIDGDCLQLDLGLRGSARIELAAIGSCLAIGGRAPRECAWRLTPGEAANVALELSQPSAAVVRGNACDLPAGRALLYVDDPASFVAAVDKAAIARRWASVRASGAASADAQAFPALSS